MTISNSNPPSLTNATVEDGSEIPVTPTTTGISDPVPKTQNTNLEEIDPDQDNAHAAEEAVEKAA